MRNVDVAPLSFARFASGAPNVEDGLVTPGVVLFATTLVALVAVLVLFTARPVPVVAVTDVVRLSGAFAAAVLVVVVGALIGIFETPVMLLAVFGAAFS